MKKPFAIILAFIAIAFVNSVQGQGEVEKMYRNRFGFSTLPFVTGTLQLNYEYLLPSRNGIWLAPLVHYTNRDYQDEIGFGLETQYRFYVVRREKENHGKNLYFAPYAFFKYFDIKEKDIYYYGGVYGDEPSVIDRKDKFATAGAGILFGWQYVFSERIYLDVYVGGGIREAFNDKDRYDEFMQPGFSGFAPKVGVDISFSF
ncbi:MAG: DUF3575 domain-containing protein [Bacteroidales bacterium]|nr:DUF3575 domain-containing protein [Bacteroidales bacterium]MCF8333729.1 DUF3575 domain-containing protein [Bacteroidales bacterium]